MERKNDTLYTVFLLIIALLVGFVIAYMLSPLHKGILLLLTSIITFLLFAILLCINHYYKKHTVHKLYRSVLARGNYAQVVKKIDSDSKEMNSLWEFKLLALFHSGNTTEFISLYRNYMNEINECATIERYQICLFHDLLVAVETQNKPISFLKNMTQTKYKYTKSIEYQLYNNIYMGLKEYYQPQRNLVKVYFEKFLQQSEEISKPLSFYLYYLMSLTMIEYEHPLCDPYISKTQSYIYDETSLQLFNNNLNQRMNSMQKGIGYQEDMDRQRDGRNFLNNNDMNTPFDKSIEMEEMGFRTSPQADENFVKRRHASEFQSDFDALNASVQTNNSYNLYEDNEYDEIAKPQQSDVHPTFPVQEEYSDSDLDPTWFARSKTVNEEPAVVANYSMRNPRLNDSMNQSTMQKPRQQRSNQVHQDPFMSASKFQDVNQVQPTMSQQQQQADDLNFMNNRTYMNTNQNEQRQQVQQQQVQRQDRNSFQQRNPMMNQNEPDAMMRQAKQPQMQQRFPNQMQQQPSQVQNPQMQQRMQNTQMMQQNMANTPQDRFSRFQQGSAAASEKPQQALPIEQPTKKKKFMRKEKESKQDPFGFDNPNAMGKDPFAQKNTNTQVKQQVHPRKEEAPRVVRKMQKESSTNYFFHSYIKSNLSIAGMTLLTAIIVSIASSSFVYTQFFNKYPINSDIIIDIVFLASLVALLMTYLIAGIHTGWTILKKPIKNWSLIAKCLTSPLLLILSLLIGAVCEIPYLIYAAIKSGNEKTMQ